MDLQQLKDKTTQTQQSLYILKSEISELLMLIEKDKAIERERKHAKRYK